MSKCILGIEQTCDECRMCNTKEVQINPELEQKYKEITKAVKESGIALDLQKELQGLIDKEFKQKEMYTKLSPMFNDDGIGTE